MKRQANGEKIRFNESISDGKKLKKKQKLTRTLNLKTEKGKIGTQ